MIEQAVLPPLTAASVQIWVPFATMIGGAVLGFLGGVGLEMLRTRSRRAELAAAAAGDEQRTMIGALAPVENLLSDVAPSRISLNASPAMFEQLQDKRGDWLAQRDRIAVAAQIHTDLAVRNGANRLNVHVTNVFTSGAWLVADLVNHAGRMKFNLALARADHAAAAAVLQVLLDAVRGGNTTDLDQSIQKIEQKRQEAEDAALEAEERDAERELSVRKPANWELAPRPEDQDVDP